MTHAQSMMQQLADIGIKLIKFQLFTKEQASLEYQSKVIDERMAGFLFDFGKDLGVDVFFSVCYPEAVDICERIGVKCYKIRYKDNQNYDILIPIMNTNKPCFISLNDHYNGTLLRTWKKLFCVPKYPAERKDYWQKDNPDLFRGVSDHTPDLQYFINKSHWYDYWEMHVKEDDNCLESAWSKKIGDLKAVLV